MPHFRYLIRMLFVSICAVLTCLSLSSCGDDKAQVVSGTVPAATAGFAKVLSTPAATYGNWLFGSANGKYLVASAEGHGTSISTDYGQTWTHRPGLGTTLTLTSGYVANDGSLWLGVGSNQGTSVYRSTDGFATVSTVTAVSTGTVGYLWKPYGLSSTVFVGNYNVIPTTIYKSTDNGLTFSPFASNTNTAYAYSISGSDDATTMLITGADWGNCASYSLDGGTTWSQAGTPTMHGMTGHTSADGTKMFVPWGYSLTDALVSTNHGSTWTAASGATGLSWASGASADHGAIYQLAYNSNQLYKSTDYGLTFSLFETVAAMAGASYSGSKQNYAVFVSRDGKVVALGGTDGVYVRYF